MNEMAPGDCADCSFGVAPLTSNGAKSFSRQTLNNVFNILLHQGLRPDSSASEEVTQCYEHVVEMAADIARQNALGRNLPDTYSLTAGPVDDEEYDLPDLVDDDIRCLTINGKG